MNTEERYKDYTICDMHEKSIDVLEELTEDLHITKGMHDIEELENMIHDAVWHLKDIIDLIKIAKEKGQSMEDRLYLYRDAIEGLGFIRKSE